MSDDISNLSATALELGRTSIDVNGPPELALPAARLIARMQITLRECSHALTDQQAEIERLTSAVNMAIDFLVIAGMYNSAQNVRAALEDKAELTRFEIDVLRTYDGQNVPGVSAGAAYNAASETLRHCGYITIAGITGRGRTALKQIELEEKE